MTGHRPGLSIDAHVGRKAAVRAIDELAKLASRSVFVTGGAIGFDQWVAQECVARDIPFELILPCSPILLGARWQRSDRLALSELCERAASVQVLRDHLTPIEMTPAIYHARNNAIVRTSDCLVAFWDRRETGGTWQTIKRAWGQRKSVFNVFSGFERVPARGKYCADAPSAGLFDAVPL